MEHLDRYEREGIDAEFEDDMDAEAALDARARAERDLDRRDVREGRVTGRRRLPGALEGVHEHEAGFMFARRGPVNTMRCIAVGSRRSTSARPPARRNIQAV